MQVIGESQLVKCGFIFRCTFFSPVHLDPVNSKKPNEFYEKLDWNKSDKQLAAETGRHRSVVYAWRIRLKKPRQQHGLTARHQKLLREARHWQWSSGVTAVAKQHGISREWAYQVARKLGLRRAP